MFTVSEDKQESFLIPTFLSVTGKRETMRRKEKIRGLALTQTAATSMVAASDCTIIIKSTNEQLLMYVYDLNKNYLLTEETVDPCANGNFLR